MPCYKWWGLKLAFFSPCVFLVPAVRGDNGWVSGVILKNVLFAVISKPSFALERSGVYLARINAERLPFLSYLFSTKISSPQTHQNFSVVFEYSTLTHTENSSYTKKVLCSSCEWFLFLSAQSTIHKPLKVIYGLPVELSRLTFE